jgi:fructose-1,6-bisphosphatase/inositol monophosphatase family enzyme
MATVYEALSRNVQAIRLNGSCALDLCGIASGRLDAYYECMGLGCWDFCAGSLVVTEAGGHVQDPYGDSLDLMKHRILAASCPELAKQIEGIIQTRTLPQGTGQIPTY